MVRETKVNLKNVYYKASKRCSHKSAWWWSSWDLVVHDAMLAGSKATQVMTRTSAGFSKSNVVVRGDLFFCPAVISKNQGQSTILCVHDRTKKIQTLQAIWRRASWWEMMQLLAVFWKELGNSLCYQKVKRKNSSPTAKTNPFQLADRAK